MRIERNHVYVIPPTHDLSMVRRHLSLSVPERRTRPATSSIDLFFRTLADAHSERAIGIVLSGTGSDGAVGIARLKEQGGIVDRPVARTTPSTTACRRARSPPARSTSCCRPPTIAQTAGRALEQCAPDRAAGRPSAAGLDALPTRRRPRPPKQALRDIIEAACTSAPATTSSTTSAPPCCAGSSGACR